MQQQKLGTLDCVTYGQPDASHAVVLFHGYGADAQDLAPLAPMFKMARDTFWVFPNAPLIIPTSYATTGHAWFPIDMAELERLMMMGRYRDFSQRTPQGLDAAASAARSALEALKQPLTQVILGGFSQGAMLATELTLTLPEAPLGLMILSGTLLNETRWMDLAKARPKMPFIQSHGSEDPILDPALAQRLYEGLTNAGWSGEWLPFHGGHEIPQPVLQAMARFMFQQQTKNLA